MRNHRIVLKPSQMRKYNTYLKNCANQVNSPTLAEMIKVRKITWRKNGQTVQKG